MAMASSDSGMAREAFLAKYPITGRIYITGNGAVVPDELQYYDGEMAQFYGECANVSAVGDALAGSGYKPVILKYADGRQTAAAQLWSNRFTDTTIGAYSAMFIVVAAVRDDVPAEQACIKAEPNGASSVLVMLDGSFDPASAVYENKARLFMVRLLDTTQVAIDVGRERMGTDKRPGGIEMSRSGRRLCLSICDERHRGVVRGDVELANDSATYMREVARAAATAGIPLRALPSGTEYVYPSAARIGRNPVVCWQWRSDLLPQLQPVAPGALVFDSSSEEGRMLLTWGFTPRVLGYIPNVRGVITGLADQPRVTQIVSSVPLLRAALPGQLPRVVGQLPVLRLVANEIARPLGTLVTTSPHEGRAGSAAELSPGQPRWGWNTTFLGSVTAMLRKEVVGDTPDGLRINWHVTEGRFVGSGVEAVILPGAADWARIRKDGIGLINVQACLETPAGEHIHASYSGVVDLGPDGYARALRDDFDLLPPVVVTPVFATAVARFSWLNRVQCVGVGRIDMRTLRLEFDVYVVNVRDRSDASTSASLYERLGGNDVIVRFTEDFVDWSLADKHLGRFFPTAHDPAALKELNRRIVEFLCDLSGGPCVYKGRDMKTAHKGLGINEADWQIAMDLFTAALLKYHVPPQAQSELLQIIEKMKNQIVEVPGGA